MEERERDDDVRVAGQLLELDGQVYVGTHDGTLYAFGFNDERRATK